MRFEPALLEPGLLVVEHEAGVRLELPVGRAGVELRLPPGPASLRLQVGGEVWEAPVKMRTGGEIECRTSRTAAPTHRQP